MSIRAAVLEAAAAVLCVDAEQLLEIAAADGGLRFDSPQAEAIVARAEDELDKGPLAEVADLASGVAATVESLTDLLLEKVTEKEAVGV